VPLLLGESARGRPLVGTSPDYYRRRGLRLAEGELPLVLGEAVVGARVAREFDLGVGDTLLTDEGNLYDLSLRSPLRLSITGVLAEAGTPDDGAVFADVNTLWVVRGIGHGHVEASEESGSRVLGTVPASDAEPERIVLGAATYEYTEITPENLDSFHFHGEPSDFPLTSLLLFPRDDRSATILKGRYRLSEAVQVIVPLEVVEEVLGLVFRVKRFFDVNSVLVTASTALFLALVLLLSVRVRRREIETLSKLGCARTTVARILAFELAIVVAAGLSVALAVSLVLERVLRDVLLA
jgi:putative ABC transport system permease protein